MPRFLIVAALFIAAACDPSLIMSGPKQNRRTIEKSAPKRWSASASAARNMRAT